MHHEREDPIRETRRIRRSFRFCRQLAATSSGRCRFRAVLAEQGADGVAREKQLLIDYLCTNAGGPLLYTGRDMLLSHKGMMISESDWEAFLGHAGATIETLGVPEAEANDVVAFVLCIKDDIVEA